MCMIVGAPETPPQQGRAAQERGSGMERQDSPSAKWWQLAFGVICMAMIANLQYGWTLFVDPIDQRYHWGRAAIQLAFTLFVDTET